MRQALDRLYDASGVAAAAFLALIALTVLVQVGFNIIDSLSTLIIGEAVGLVLPSYAEFTGYFLASSSFLAAAHTLRRGAHIRVGLILQRLGPKARQVAEVWATGVGAILAIYFTWWMWLLVEESLRFNDVSPGLIPVPIWIPQAGMALGLTIFAIALIDACAAAVKGDYIAEPDQPGEF
ncbi:MAG: TRAP transporter small permease [Pseudomonadota bacterium]